MFTISALTFVCKILYVGPSLSLRLAIRGCFPPWGEWKAKNVGLPALPGVPCPVLLATISITRDI